MYTPEPYGEGLAGRVWGGGRRRGLICLMRTRHALMECSWAQGGEGWRVEPGEKGGLASHGASGRRQRLGLTRREGGESGGFTFI